MLWVALRFPLLPPATLEAIGAWACQFTPKVSLEPPRALLLEVEGSLRLFGGLPFLKQKLQSGLEEMGFNAALATAATPRAALWLSCAGCERIDDVALEAVCHDEAQEFLRSIGMHTVGELSRLPREGLALRRAARAAGAARPCRGARVRRAAAPGAARRLARRPSIGRPALHPGPPGRGRRGPRRSRSRVAGARRPTLHASPAGKAFVAPDRQAGRGHPRRSGGLRFPR